MEPTQSQQLYKDRLKADVDFLISYYQSLASKKNIESIMGLGGDLARVARYKLMINPEKFTEAKRDYYKSGCSHLLYLRLYSDRYLQYRWKDKSSPSFVATTFYGAKEILLSDSSQLIHTFFSEIERLPEDTYKNKVDISICYALKYLILKNNEQAKIHLNDLYLKAKGLTKGLGYVLAGILFKDVNLVNEGIKIEIRMHRVNNKTSVFYSFAEEATAWAKLARQFGFDPDVRSEFIHQGMLRTHDNIEYEDITEVYKALKIDPL